jgi:hypothetical protein
MKYVAAYMLAVLGGNASPKAKDIEKILGKYLSFVFVQSLLLVLLLSFFIYAVLQFDKFTCE